MEKRKKQQNKKNKILSIVFMPTFSCDCTCDYCFEINEPVTVKDDFWVKIFEAFRIYSEKAGFTKLRFYWQGGEILTMSPEQVKKGLEECTSVFKASGIHIEHRLQSNLIAYSSDWAPIVNEYFHGHIGSSLDFPNLYRKTASLDQTVFVERWIEKKELALQDGISVSVIALPNNQTFINGAESFYNFYLNKAKLKSIQINFPFIPPNSTFSNMPDMERFAQFMEELYGIWIQSDRSLRIEPFGKLENAVFHDDNCLTCIWSYCCAFSLLAIDPLGRISQCDCWSSSFKEHSFGDIRYQSIETILESPNRKKFLERPLKLLQNTECGNCTYWHLCYGGCPTRATTMAKNFFSKDPYCPVYKKYFLYSLKT